MKKYILIITLAFYLPNSAVAQFSIDLQTHAHLLTLINSHNEANNLASEQVGKFDSVKETLGGFCDHEVLKRNGDLISNFLSTTLGISTSTSFALESLVEDPLDIDNWRNANYTAEQIERTLFYKEDEDGMISYEEIDRVTENRNKMLDESTKSSLTLATTKQATIDDTQRTIVELNNRASSSTNIHEDGMTTNQLLAIIANAVVSNEQINAKRLELESAFYAQVQSQIIKKVPLAKRNRNTNTSASREARRRSVSDITVGSPR